MIQLFKKTICLLILLLAVGESIFPLRAETVLAASGQNSVAGHYDGTSLLYAFCSDITQGVQDLMDAASPVSRLKGTGNSSNDAPVIAAAFTPTNMNLSVSSILTACPFSNSPVNALLSFFQMLLLLLTVWGAIKFSAYLPRQGIVAAVLRDNVHKNPHWFIRASEGFSIAYYSSSGGRHA